MALIAKCKYIKKEGSGCSLNDNCRYPNCDDRQQNILKQLAEITKGKAILLLILLTFGCKSTKDIYTVSEKKVDSLYYSSQIETKPPIASSLIINEICDSVTNKPVQFKKQFITKNDTILIEVVNDDLQIKYNFAQDTISKQDSIIKVQISELKESRKITKTKTPFKFWLYLIASIAVNILLTYLLIKSKFSFKNLI